MIVNSIVPFCFIQRGGMLHLQILTDDVKARKNYYAKNKKIFESFIFKTMDRDMQNYPDEKSGIDVMEVTFLSFMTMEIVDEIIKDTIVKKKAPPNSSWNVLTLKDAFRTLFFYCKYPKELASFLTEEMRVDVKEWLDSTGTWGKWGFDDDVSEGSEYSVQPNNDTLEFGVKMEL